MRPVALLLSTLSIALLSAAAAPAADAAGSRLSAGERALVRAVNGVRARHGLSRVAATRSLSRAADHHSRRMIAHDFFAHGAMAQRVRRYGHFRRVGETLAMVSRCGRRGARLTVRMWMGSSTHRAIVLSRGFRRIGVGARRGRLGASRTCVVTADFASRR
jgi:uncharacterized protein YkwD